MLLSLVLYKTELFGIERVELCYFHTRLSRWFFIYKGRKYSITLSGHLVRGTLIRLNLFHVNSVIIERYS